MRGSIKTQITAALKHCSRFKESRHSCKKTHGGRSPFIHSLGTFDKVAHRLWPLKDWMKEKGLKDLELLTNGLVLEYLEHRLAYHLEIGNSRQSFKVEVAALGNLERGLRLFSESHRDEPTRYDFSAARASFTQKAKQLPKVTGGYHNRALPNPLGLIDALEQPGHRLMACLQYYCGCRCEGVGSPRRDLPGGNRLALRNFILEGEPVLPAPTVDPVTGETARLMWTREKGGKVAFKHCPLWLADEVLAWLAQHPEGLGDSYESYLAAINRAMKSTGQSVRGKGTHALRFNFAQRRYAQCIQAGLGDEEAKRFVSHEMSHNRPDITEGYCR